MWRIFFEKIADFVNFSVQKYHLGGGWSEFLPKHKSIKGTFVQQGVGGSRRDPKHKSMYKCAYMYVHLYLCPPPPAKMAKYAFWDNGQLVVKIAVFME